MISMDRNTSPITPFSADDYLQAYQITGEHKYPSEEINRFKENYAKINGWDSDTIELANGSDEWLQKLMISYGEGGVLALAPDFFMYQDYAQQIKVKIDFVQSNADFDFSLKDILIKIKEIKPRLFILSNPHNPTGKQFTEVFLQEIADAMAEIEGYFAIDEAYIEFGSDYQRPQGDHVIILRTMSKIYGMAGLRIGIMKATGQTFKDLTSINHPYPVNSLALNLASIVLEDSKRLEGFINYQIYSRDMLKEMFKYTVKTKETDANFVFTYGKDAVELGQYLLTKGFKGRFYKEKGMEEVVRYSIIKLGDYQKLGQAIEEWKRGSK